MASSSSSSDVQVRHVWASNLEEEFRYIDKCLPPDRRQFTFVSMDTEFPGTIYNPDGVPPHMRAPAEFYSNIKRNVDALKIIQLGLTIFDRYGNLPRSAETGREQIWEFNFQFDSAIDPYNKESVSLLEKQGIDLSRNKKYGIDSREFALLFKCSELGMRSYSGRLVWLTFHGPYDFAYLTKILNNGYFKGNVYDLKSMIPFVGLHGGLEKVARSLNLKRVVGKSHQAGSDSLLTMHAFFGNTGLEMMQTLFGLFGLMKRNSCSGLDGLLTMQTIFGLNARAVF
ncbi:hypothetical protein MIMGU_mgv1a027156mg [Erythranthe guttata]|uniref:poly(A)-specific ribonuclease n=1 Tax=Erythranthe guttata TaxID=4155 RepID=A0A022R943_ERYGU|nr:hypothetical protein MIMGU_mgv1a027156mg [Erythranthe guttata]